MNVWEQVIRGEGPRRLGTKGNKYFPVLPEGTSALEREWPGLKSQGLPQAAHAYLMGGLKRCLDLVLVVFSLPLSLLLVGLAALALKLGSRGPVFFVQDRLGRDGRPFRCFKLRTMIVGAETDGPQWAREQDPRVTWVGRILRKTRLDELPQLYNVWRGEMSMVGPRPIRRHFAELLTGKVPLYPLRFTAKPGLTGWDQVHNGYPSTLEAQIRKFHFDLHYLERASFWLDLRIVIKTVWVLFSSRGQ